jgi:hypothetical protein
MTSVEHVTIQAPKIDETNENLYKFDLLAPNGEPLIHKSDCLYSINIENETNEQMLTIPSKEELRSLSNIFNTLKSSFLERHDEWFEEKFTSSTLDDLFKNFLYPNIVENCIDLKIFVTTDMMNKLKEVSTGGTSVNIIPTFSFDTINLNIDDNKMNCIVSLKDFSIEVNKKMEEPVVEKEPIVEEEPVVEEEPNVNPEDELSELKEMDFDTSNLIESEIKVNVEDYMIIYKYILGKIKENKIREIEKICESKNIDMEIVDCEDIFNESEDEYFSSDAESENSDDETSFN